ncbi:Arginine-glutamic acid dipeptide repeats protein [Actinidia chinensis var. chinensis]|uniref:Arginine-glutamic acid dipeptide repeats protein n=1 Tax=Actinidia chinensis var. chinensis TaxID=1590841 RepID=A0A2R6P5X1_ACTCC|nr:Arginine-glutamic acid dipeptide repeats protein [Actinidia chinensis var. chinensis]
MDGKMENVIVKSADQFLSLCSSNVGDIFGDPLVLPRVGDQYQVEIPPLMTECCRQQFMQKLTDPEIMTEYLNNFALGLPMPIMWVPVEVENNKMEAQDVLANQDGVVDTNWSVEVETSEDRQITLTKLGQGENDYSPLPGLLGEPWRPIEHDSFLLGLYIFGKNLLLMKRFVESKEMGDILSYYYGKFYGSSEHHKWSVCRKIRNKRCINGQKIFTGWRQKELLSRLCSHVSEECLNTLSEVSREFGDWKISLEEYVFTLKDTVGIKILVEAVGIGKGKQDLTGTTMDPIKTNNSLPIGKACSSLTSEEIIKFITGDFRLSKARSNDLFWEAVWPRLLARGWHSEQPKFYSFTSSKHSLVFLIPGVKKFSRRRHVKGDHYFDSVSDVLKKVASDPGLLEVETEAAKANGPNEEYPSDLPVKQSPVSLSNWQRQRYLQPPISNCNGDLLKFTIVDTSLVHGEDRSKVRELRTLPLDTRNTTKLSDFSSETEQNSSEESQDKERETNDLNLVEDTTESGTFTDSRELNSTQDNALPNGTCENNEFQVGQSQILLSCSSLAQAKADEIDQTVVDGNCLVTEPSSEKPQPDTLIDLNLPHVPEDMGTDETFITDTVPILDKSGTKMSLVLSETNRKYSNGESNAEKLPALIGRRQSKRNRPLTTRALEAIAYGFLSTRKRKRVDAQTQSDSMSRSSRSIRDRPASGSTLTGNADNDIA